MNINSEFLFNEPTMSFRALRRKGYLRYIASKKIGCLASIINFAPPTKFLPRLIFSIIKWIDFQVPRLTEDVKISEEFLNSVSQHLQIPTEQIGIYLGEPNDEQKLVIMDTAKQSDYILKMAIKPTANLTIERESEAVLKAKVDERWSYMVPDLIKVNPIKGRSTILIERIDGRQLTANRFEKEFLDSRFWYEVLYDSEKNDSRYSNFTSIRDWMEQKFIETDNSIFESLIEDCNKTGALELRSLIGVVHGDFTPWNILSRRADYNRKIFSVKMTCKNNSVFQSFCAVDWEFSKDNTPLIFDYAYAVWCYDKLLGKKVKSITLEYRKQLISLGALWMELRKIL